MKTGYYNCYASVAQAQEELKAEGYTCHHSAMSRGYLPSKNIYVDEYKGTFGEGYILNIPNQRTTRPYHSNGYHPIEYWVK